MQPVIIYTLEYCPYCIRAKKRFDELKVPYIEISITKEPAKYAEIQKRTHWDTVPQIFIGDQFIGGCDDMMALDAKGELIKLLKI